MPLREKHFSNIFETWKIIALLTLTVLSRTALQLPTPTVIKITQQAINYLETISEKNEKITDTVIVY